MGILDRSIIDPGALGALCVRPCAPSVAAVAERLPIYHTPSPPHPTRTRQVNHVQQLLQLPAAWTCPRPGHDQQPRRRWRRRARWGPAADGRGTRGADEGAGGAVRQLAPECAQGEGVLDREPRGGDQGAGHPAPGGAQLLPDVAADLRLLRRLGGQPLPPGKSKGTRAAAIEIWLDNALT